MKIEEIISALRAIALANPDKVIAYIDISKLRLDWKISDLGDGEIGIYN